ncbi:MAG TPA: ROK family protein [Solirubrobacteraceae bacterium]|jgi:fructokinase|nr:ROK family protein [Solirubrobacteraceae bacterium]
MAPLYGGVETGGTWCVCALGCRPGEIVAREQFPTASPEETLDRIAQFFESHPRPAALGVGAFGPLVLDERSPRWGYVTTTPKPGWRDTSVAQVLRDRLGLPTAFDTDVGAAALAEHRWGAGIGAPSLCYLTVGTGIGAGLIHGRAIWHGLIHPEVGHMRVPHDRERDPFGGSCPVHGDCWEGLAAGSAIARRWGADPEELPDDHPAWQLAAGYVALGILAIVSVASPHRIVAGGGVLQRPVVLQAVRRRVPELLAGYLDDPLLGARIDDFIVTPALGDDAGVLGAIALAQDLVRGQAGSTAAEHR